MAYPLLKMKTVATVTVTTAGTRVPISATSLLVYGLSVQSHRSNTGYQYLGDETVDSSNGYEFAPSDVAEYDPPKGSKEPMQFDLKDVYLDSSTNGATFRVTAWIRK